MATARTPQRRAKATRPARDTKKPRPTVRRDPPLPEVHGSQACYDVFLPVARALAPDEVFAFRADATLAYLNVCTGVHGVLEHEAKIRAELPGVDLGKLRMLPDLARAMVYGAEQVEQMSTSPGRLSSLLARARPLRELMLASAHALALAGLIPPRSVAAIQQGTGMADVARDCLQLATLFRKRAVKVRNKSPVTAQHLREASEVGKELLELLKAASLLRDRRPSPEMAEALDARDRLWTLLVLEYGRLERIAGWLWGKDFGDHVPMLQSPVQAPAPPPAEAPPAAPVPAD